MKTFDEAFEAVNKSERLKEDLLVCAEYMDNPQFVELIECTAIRMLYDFSCSNDRDDLLSIICSNLHLIFQSGLLCGLEMEKEDAFHKK
jgi:hypothetical protein